MARHTTGEIYAAARAVGLSSAQAVLATAVAVAESGNTGLDDTAKGDIALQNNTWGPSVGVWQIRTLKAQTGQGTDRDIAALSGNLSRQAQAMKAISSGGTNFGAWTTYTRGTYQKFLGQATAAAVGSTTGASLPTTNTALGLPGAGAIGDVLNSAVEPARNLAVKLLVTALGFAVFAGGVILAVSPQARKGPQELVKEAKEAPSKIAGAL